MNIWNLHCIYQKHLHNRELKEHLEKKEEKFEIAAKQAARAELLLPEDSGWVVKVVCALARIFIQDSISIITHYIDWGTRFYLETCLHIVWAGSFKNQISWNGQAFLQAKKKKKIQVV